MTVLFENDRIKLSMTKEVIEGYIGRALLAWKSSRGF